MERSESRFCDPTPLFEDPKLETLYFTRVWGDGGGVQGGFRGPAAVFGRRGEDYRRGEELTDAISQPVAPTREAGGLYLPHPLWPNIQIGR